ncbi:putative wall-associated receptor kinase-like 16 [Cryptomeria japonica]|uniref:putative wall-associated receptor kinase-like 16 n=1 Tax=Cryptomeria japonica TaxID=3369 RepID=UPI0027DAB416|nr:putative wall-associated receptor kinase-like 16 [Cryptomeria japonica]
MTSFSSQTVSLVVAQHLPPAISTSGPPLLLPGTFYQCRHTAATAPSISMFVSTPPADIPSARTLSPRALSFGSNSHPPPSSGHTVCIFGQVVNFYCPSVPSEEHSHHSRGLPQHSVCIAMSSTPQCPCQLFSQSIQFYLFVESAGSVSSFVGFFVVASGILWCLSMRCLKHARDTNFLQNGWMQLQESIASMGGRKSLRIVSQRELEIDSNNYSTELGKGGFATVYKGILADSTLVAIKKPKSISDEFINEVIILSHINHRNVVKLPKTTEAIAYVHLQASQPIFHRDIKSLNILLDNTFTAKVADFGISKLLPSDERHLSTILPSGTPGYVDPEFVKSTHFTDKSDVFNFGVVLVEISTCLMAVLSTEGSMCGLSDHFLSVINENHFTEILDPKVVNEENQEEMENIERLEKSCLQMKARARSSMREVVEEIAWIRASTRQLRLYSNVSLVEHRGDPKQARQNYYAPPTTCVNYSKNLAEDHYCSSPPITTISSEGPSTALIQTEMSDTYAR